MPDLVIDTQIAIWHFEDSPRLSSNAVNALAMAVTNGDDIYLPTISLVEIVYLIEKGRLVEESLTILINNLESPESSFRTHNLTPGIAESLRQIRRDIVPDMPDRIIAATALHLALPLITSDADIRKLKNIETIW